MTKSDNSIIISTSVEPLSFLFRYYTYLYKIYGHIAEFYIKNDKKRKLRIDFVWSKLS